VDAGRADDVATAGAESGGPGEERAQVRPGPRPSGLSRPGLAATESPG